MAKRAGFILCLVVCALGVGATHALADTPPPPTVIADGVLIGSVDVGGMTSDEATVAVQDAYFARVALHVGHRGYSVSPHHFHTALPLAPAIQAALTAPADTTVDLTPALDSKIVVKWVKTLAGKTDRAPVAGRVVLRHDRPFLVGSHPGRALRRMPTRMLIRDAILSGTRTVIVAPLKKLKAAAAKPAPVIVIHRGINRLYLYNGTHLVRVFPVATGQAAWPTPLGDFQIVVKQKNPWWFPPTQDSWAAGAKPVPPGPGNPLGTRWMGLSAPGVGIHGTDEPWSIGHSESHGCIRMQVPSAEWLYNRVQVGTPVFIISA
ncbi:MAG TPA: L,D-transpeptidase family protein [Gaiellaceae bacterium]|nr:L,D-transpeptidase family protein [Gaiellaceae bacterium]